MVRIILSADQVNELVTPRHTAECGFWPGLFLAVFLYNLSNLPGNAELLSVRVAIDQQRLVDIAAGSELIPRQRSENNNARGLRILARQGVA